MKQRYCQLFTSLPAIRNINSGCDTVGRNVSVNLGNLTHACHRKKPVVGVIYAPFASGLSSHPNDSYFGTLYSGAHGLGSFVTNVTPDSFADLVKPRRRQQQTCSPTKYSVSLPLLRPVPPLSQEAPKGCLFMAEWGKDRRDSLNSNLTRKVNSMWNMACETGGRQDRGG
jgi:myo-inositol-1(or 4)-monophosphatase